MAISYQTYTGNGSLTTFPISFDWIYASDVVVTVDGSTKVNGTDYTIVNKNVVFTLAPSNGTVVKVARSSNLTSRNVDFVNGSRLDETDLDNSAKQLFYLIQEIKDQTDALSTQIVNAAAALIVDGSVTNTKLSTDAVTASKITNGAVTPAKLSTGGPTWDTGGNVSLMAGRLLSSTFIACKALGTIGANVFYNALTSAWNYIENGAGWVIADASGALTFNTAPTNSSGPNAVATITERLRIDSSGNVGIGTAAPQNSIHIENANPIIRQRNSGATAGLYKYTNVDASNNYIIANQAGTGVYLAATGTSWTVTSDERLKENLQPIPDALNKVASIRSVTGKYKTDPEGTSRAFLIAQDVQAVLPEAVNVQQDEMQTLGVAYTDVIPLLVGAIKELKAEVEALKKS